jgi:hypothetical protein
LFGDFRSKSVFVVIEVFTVNVLAFYSFGLLPDFTGLMAFYGAGTCLTGEAWVLFVAD